ncbi:MAG: hypothetical protein AVDCRST_MAG50-1226 [uncultured Acidimicrobiales bacterium]|uniref:Methyltransferase domain-containing protein n=1 Tax=uncultured Acidimicrobiales bacterium TaxID=310071 RepID=A0A6J4HUI1_9ACTN|nr:MAG: hypothetical protein AVDCRST_MAG50-1226 [uncultured Acidimicrobiales bacterium]
MVSAWGDRYARGFSEMAGVYVDLTRQATQLLDVAALDAGESVLDVGCGPGTATLVVADRVGPEGRVIGVDLAPGMLARASAATSGTATILAVMDARQLAFGDGTFDVVTANSVLQFTGRESLGEWPRVTRPGGRVACSIPYGPAMWFELCRRYVHRTSEPYRSTMQARLDTAVGPPDAEQARALWGFGAVGAVVERLVRRYDSADEAWESEYQHGARVFLEELPADALERFRAEYVEALLPEGDGGGVAIPFEFHYWCFTR